MELADLLLGLLHMLGEHRLKLGVACHPAHLAHGLEKLMLCVVHVGELVLEFFL